MSEESRARALLDALVRESSPPPQVCERALALVESRIVAGEVEAEPPRRSAELVRAAGLAIAIAAAVLLVLRLATWSVHELRDSAAHESASDVVVPPRNDDARDAAPTGSIATPPAIAPTLEVPPQSAAPASAPVRARLPTQDAAPRAARRSDADDLAAEAALIRAAKSAADDRGALVLLDRHAQSFPDGTLSREREMLRAERLCALGRVDDAHAVATRFLADGSDDPLARRMRKVCAAR